MQTNRAERVVRAAPIAAIAGLLIALFGWAIASPVGASPDEDFHLVSIWCASGGAEGLCEPTDNPQTRQVSSSLLQASCYAQKPLASAECQTTNEVFESPTLVESKRGNFSGAYPSGFYAFMHLFASDNIQLSVIVMRIVNALLFGLILVALWMLLPPSQRQSLYFAVLLPLVPLGLFLIPSINPSSWAIIAAFTTFFAVIGALSEQQSRRRRKLLWGLSAFGLILAASSRYDGLLYSSVAFIAAILIAYRFAAKKKTLLLAGSIAIGVGLLVIVFGGWHLMNWLAAFAGDIAHHDMSASTIFFANILTLPLLFAGFSGASGLGWLDTEMPYLAWMFAATLLWGSLFDRLRYASRQQLWVATGVTGLLIVIPLAVLQSQMATVGQNVQARYLYPLMIVLVGVLLYRSKLSRSIFSTVQVGILSVGLFASQGASLFFNMSRYISVGKFPRSPNLDASAADGWWWMVGPSPMTVLAVTSIGFGLFLAMGFVFAKRHLPQPKNSTEMLT